MYELYINASLLTILLEKKLRALHALEDIEPWF